MITAAASSPPSFLVIGASTAATGTPTPAFAALLAALPTGDDSQPTVPEDGMATAALPISVLPAEGFPATATVLPPTAPLQPVALPVTSAPPLSERQSAADSGIALPAPADGSRPTGLTAMIAASASSALGAAPLAADAIIPPVATRAAVTIEQPEPATLPRPPAIGKQMVSTTALTPLRFVVPTDGRPTADATTDPDTVDAAPPTSEDMVLPMTAAPVAVAVATPVVPVAEPVGKPGSDRKNGATGTSPVPSSAVVGRARLVANGRPAQSEPSTGLVLPMVAAPRFVVAQLLPIAAAPQAPLAPTPLPVQIVTAAPGDVALATAGLPVRSVSGETAAAPILAVAAPVPVAAPIAVRSPAPLPVGTAGPALQVFHAAIAAASQREEVRDPAPAADQALVQAVAAAPAAHVAAVGDAQQAPLDLTHQRWPHAMIDRIEQLRDAAADVAGATETRIRLIPDALGGIDVSVKRDGDTLHVHFAAEQAATRTLIQDAQPRLAAIAEERGLRLGEGTVGAGTGGQSQPQPRTPSAVIPPAPARPSTDNDDETAASGRLA